MGKKFAENTKVAAAKEKKELVANEKKQKEMAEKERKLAEEWSVGSKKNKKEEEEAKRLEKLAKKAEKEALEAKESQEIDQIKKVKPRGAEKIAVKREQKIETQTQEKTVEVYAARSIDDALTLLSLTNSSSSSSSSSAPSGGSKVNVEDFLVKNQNGESSADASVVRVSSADAIERHPERRMKAAYTKYEEKELPIIKQENPGLRFTQLKEIIWKNWQKSPENPLNQQHIDYNLRPSEEKKIIVEEKQAKLESMRISN